MKRVAVLFVLLAMPFLASCSYPASHYGVKSVTGYVSINDDRDLTCLSPLLIAATVNDSVWVRCEWWQGSLLKSDSTRTPRVVWLTFQPPIEVPTAAQVESRVFVRDVGGTSCMAKYQQMPTQALVRPASFSGLSVAP